MKLSVLGFVFAVFAFVALRAVFASVRKLIEGSAPPSSALPAAQARRPRRHGGPPAKAGAPSVAAAPVATPLPSVRPGTGAPKVARPERIRTHVRLAGRDALRQAIVAREVLGPPLSLRPPRF